MDFVNFVVKYWKYFSIGLVIVFNLLLFILKKKPIKVVDAIKQFLLINLPEWIRLAESTGASGYSKKQFVLDLASSFMKENGFEFTAQYQYFVKQAIEDILNTPQKKGVKK